MSSKYTVEAIYFDSQASQPLGYIMMVVVVEEANQMPSFFLSLSFSLPISFQWLISLPGSRMVAC